MFSLFDENWVRILELALLIFNDANDIVNQFIDHLLLDGVESALSGITKPTCVYSFFGQNPRGIALWLLLAWSEYCGWCCHAEKRRRLAISIMALSICSESPAWSCEFSLEYLINKILDTGELFQNISAEASNTLRDRIADFVLMSEVEQGYWDMDWAGGVGHGSDENGWFSRLLINEYLYRIENAQTKKKIMITVDSVKTGIKTKEFLLRNQYQIQSAMQITNINLKTFDYCGSQREFWKEIKVACIDPTVKYPQEAQSHHPLPQKLVRSPHPKCRIWKQPNKLSTKIFKNSNSMIRVPYHSFINRDLWHWMIDSAHSSAAIIIKRRDLHTYWLWEEWPVPILMIFDVEGDCREKPQ